MASHKKSTSVQSKRNFLIFLASFAAIYPVFRFLGFSIPRKPRIIELSQSSLTTGGFHIASDYILFDDGTDAWAISRKCTHLGCTINLHEEDKLLECPCHQSRFTTEGLVMQGPAERALTRYKVETLKDGGGYIVTI